MSPSSLLQNKTAAIHGAIGHTVARKHKSSGNHLFAA